MLTIFARNVAQALPKGLALLREVGKEEASRAGPVLVAPCPVMTIYDRPCERVLFSAERDANPFFHLAEALWMLAGRNDAAFLNLFIRNFGEQFAQPNGTVHGAYGFRWREMFSMDQLDEVVRILKEEPLSRQAVLTMWNPNVDLGFPDLKDRPCNTQIYFRILDARLQMTVMCRSNDILWGAYGANAVHFSVLQEYLAARIGVKVGIYYQFSNNFHAYISELEKHWEQAMVDERPELKPISLVDDVNSFDAELDALLILNKPPNANRFLAFTAYPLLQAHADWRRKKHGEVYIWLSHVEAPDWQAAATEWVDRRMAHVKFA
jgi:thymidylate synthase